MKTGKNTTASLLAALLLGSASAPVWAQAGGAGAGGAGAGGAGAGGAGAGGAGTGASAGTGAGAGAGTGAAGNGTGGAAGTGAGAAGTAAGGNGTAGTAAGGNGTAGTAAGGNGAAGAGNGTAGAGSNGANGNGANGNGANGNGANGNGANGNGANGNGANGNGANGNGANGNGANGNGANGNGANGNGSGTNGSGSANGGSTQTTRSLAPQHYDVARTVADAITASADVQTATRNVEIDRKQADYLAARGRPNVNAQGQAIRYDQRTQIGIGAGPPLTVTFDHKEILSLNLGEQLDVTGQIRAATDQYRLQSLADQFVLRQYVNARILRAKNLYFNLLETSHQVQVAQANLADAEQSLRDTQNQNSAGTGLKLDLLRARTVVAQDQTQLSQAQDDFGIAQTSFNDLVGRPLSTPITLDDVPGVTVGQSPTSTGAVGAPTGNEALFAPPTAEVAGINLDASLQTAYTHRPEILADQVNVRVADTGVKLARAGLEPTLRADVNGFYYPTTDFQSPRRRVVQATATLTIPLYDGNATHDLIQEAHLRRDNAQTTLESQTSDVTLDVRQSYLNLLTAAQQIASANTALQSAVAARQNAEIRYRGGVGLFLEVTDAQAALVQAQNSQINAVYNYQIARAQFENAIGVPQTR